MIRYGLIVTSLLWVWFLLSVCSLRTRGILSLLTSRVTVPEKNGVNQFNPESGLSHLSLLLSSLGVPYSPPQYSCTPIKLWCWSGKSCSMAGALQMNEDTSSLAPVYEEAKSRKIFAYMSFPNPS